MTLIISFCVVVSRCRMCTLLDLGVELAFILGEREVKLESDQIRLEIA